jgi:TRAP-type uncharacterized transport system fused permease subunit
LIVISFANDSNINGFIIKSIDNPIFASEAADARLAASEFGGSFAGCLSLSKTLIVVSGGNSFALLFLTAIGAIVLGMGMPIAATYIMLVILLVPALVQTGIDPMAAHLFINFFGAMSFVTPPVCVAAYVAAGIAQTNPIKTGFTSMRLGIGAYLVPFAFCYSGGLLLQGTLGEILYATGITLLALIAFAIALSGQLLGRLTPIRTLLFIGGGILMIFPAKTLSAAGLVVIALTLAWEWFDYRRQQ